MWSLWPPRRRSSAPYGRRRQRQVKAAMEARPQVTNTRFVISQIIADFEYFVAAPPLDGYRLGEYADYSCNSPEDRAERAVTIHLNRMVSGISMPDVMNFIALELEMNDFRPVLPRNNSSELQIRVPAAFKNAQSS